MKNQFLIKLYHVEGYKVYEHKNYKPGRISFSFLMEGEALLEVNGKNFLLNPGQMLLVPADQDIIIKHVSNAVGYDGSFSLDFLKDVSYPVLRNEEAMMQSFWFDDAVFMGALFKRMLTAYEDKDWAFLQSAIDMVLGQLRGTSRVAAIPERFLQLVFDRDKAPMNVADYANLLNVTPNYLNKTVKNHTHRTAIDWIEIARLNMAKQYLKDRSLSIAQIAEKTGLVDQSYFSRFFKKKTGLTPSEFRNSF
jgi:AraC-like DNA-binding protein